MVPKFVPFGWTEILLSVSPAQPPLLAQAPREFQPRRFCGNNSNRLLVRLLLESSQTKKRSGQEV